MVSAASSAPPSSWRKRWLALFVTVAMAGLVVGLIAAFKPEAFNGHKMQDGDALSTPGGVPSTVDKMVETLPTTATSTEKATAPAASAGPAAPAASAAPAAPLVPADLVDKPQLDIVKNTNADLLAGLLNSQSKESVSSSSSSTTQANDSISSDKQKEKGKFLQQLVQATSILGATTLQGGCMPADGMELRRMVEDPNACTIITLRPGKVYNVALEGKADDITVRSRKVIIGNPISLPTIDGTASKRIFHVVSGGSLDLQFLRTYRGSGELIATIPVLRGGTALVELGGRISAFGVVFTNAPPVGVPPFLVGADLSRAVRVFGGQIFNAGGIMTITLSHFWVLQPGVLLRELYVVGGDVLMVSGVAVFSGCTFTNSQLFLNGFGSGYQVAVLAGVLICSGVTFTVNMVGINCTGAGILSFLGGGVAIFSGCTWIANAGALSYFGSGIMIFEGGGVLVISGGAMGINLGVGTQIGTGMMVSVGGGTVTATGLTQEVSSGADFTAGSGVFNWNGAGSAVYVGFTQSRSIGAVGVYSTGGGVSMGSGDLVIVGAATANNFGVASVVLIGANWFLGAGILVEIACPFTINAGVLFATLIGIDGFVGAGTAVVGWSPHSINVGKAYLNPNASLYVVNGAKVNPAVTSFKIGKGGSVTPLGKNKTRLLLPEEEEVVASAAVASLNILKGANTVNDGTPSPLLAQLQNSALGEGMLPFETVYANVNGDGTTCNACGFEGDMATQFIGNAAGACSNTESAGASCSLPGVQVMRGDGQTGPLPSWMLKAAGHFDKSSGKTTPLDTSIISAVFKVGCSPTAAKDATTTLTHCLDAAAVINAIKASLGTDCARMNLQAKNAMMHPDIDMQDNWANYFADSAHTDVYDLAFTTHDAACTTQVTEWVKGFAPEEFLGTLDAPGNVKLEATDVTLEMQHFVRGMDLHGAAKEVLANMVAAVADTGLPTVLVQGMDEGTGSAVGRFALPKVASGSTANVALANFFDDKPVAMELTTKCMAVAAKDAVVALGSFKPADQLAVQIPAGTSPGTYSLRASQNGLFWCSQPIDVY
ncbi:hypothetical protein VYU27_009412 [Nannochloropsis oceanica]